MCSPLPEDWSEKAIEDVVDPARRVTYGIVQPGPRTPGGIPIIRGQDYSSGTVSEQGLYEVHPSIADAYQRSTVRGGDLLLSIVGYVGQTAEVPDSLTGANLTQTTSRLAIRLPHSIRYFLHYLRGSQFRLEVNRFTKGSAQPGLNLADVEVMRVRFPRDPLEQHRIAEILDTIDDAIGKTEEIIAKLQQMKQGMLHDLLTRGIDDNGELRDPGRHPEQFKDSQLGRIPDEWETVPLGDLVQRHGGLIQTGPFGSQLHAYEYVDEGVPVVMPQDITTHGIDLSRIAHITAAKALTLQRHAVQPSDVLFARRGDLSRCVPISTRENGWLCGTGCLLVRLSNAVMLGQWLAACYVHDSGQRQILGRAVGSTMVNLNGAILKDLLVPRPSIEEQTECVRRSGLLAARIGSEERELDVLRLLKQGLMDDLLTGRVRVSVPEVAAR